MANEGAQVTPFAVVTAGTSPSQIPQLRCPTMLAADDMVHLAAPESVRFMDEAVLADVISALGYLTTQPFSHVSCHEPGVGGRGLWPAA